MRRLSSLLGLALLLLSPVLSAQTRDDSLAIRRAAADYIEGWYSGNGDRMAQALLGLKLAVEKAMAANGGKKPSPEQLAAALRNSEWESPAGKIRMALGEQRAGIARLVLASAARLGVAGCAIGVLGSLAASRIVSSFLFEVSATDPLIYGTAVGLMLLMTLLASVIPASRAAAADPNTVLRAV